MKTSPCINYIDCGLILSLRSHLDEIGGPLWVEKSWQPQLQQEGDHSLMEKFLKMHCSKSERIHLCRALHWLRVITIADLADPTGRTLPGDQLTGNWRAPTLLEWPHTTKPGPKSFATLRRFIKNTICLDESPHQAANAD